MEYSFMDSPILTPNFLAGESMSACILETLEENRFLVFMSGYDYQVFKMCLKFNKQ